MSLTPQALLEKVSPRAGPLIITVFGDTIAPRGGSIWLGHLIELMQPLGLSERLVRTGVYRLAREGWLKARQNGRRSSYTITSRGLNTFADADARIYAAQPLAWDGEWIMVQSCSNTTPKTRKETRNILTWLGFGRLSPTLMIKPGSDTTTVNQVLRAAKLDNTCTIFISRLDTSADQYALVSNCWNLDDLSNSYGKLLQCFAHAEDIAKNNVENPQAAFIVRSLLIHQYRRILLKDPQLPSALLPSSWNGEKARDLVARAYRILTPFSDQFVNEKLQSGKQDYPKPNPPYKNRFRSD